MLGASVEERGFEEQVTAGGVCELLREAHDSAQYHELQIEEAVCRTAAGLPDNVPVIGAGVLAGLIWATGHHRNGILLAPLTAELVLQTLIGKRTTGHLPLTACDPSRFQVLSPVGVTQ